MATTTKDNFAPNNFAANNFAGGNFRGTGAPITGADNVFLKLSLQRSQLSVTLQRSRGAVSFEGIAKVPPLEDV